MIQESEAAALALMEVTELYAGYGACEPVVRDLSFRLGKGETLGLCGPSGCGKTTVIWAILGMLGRYGGYAGGSAIYQGKNLLALTDRQWRPLRWNEIALVPQSSMSALNPVYTVRRTFIETLRTHGAYGVGAEDRINGLLDMAGLDTRILKQYPHELSGGMRQRVSIALSMLLGPNVLILDEPTSGLDVVVEADILKLIRDMQKERGFGILFVSHDRRITGEFCHRRINFELRH